MLQVSHPAGQVIKPDSWLRIDDEGMPIHGRPFQKGNLYIHFSVKFPDTLDEVQVDGLKAILPPVEVEEGPDQGPMDTDDMEQVNTFP